MNLELTDEQVALRDTVRRFLAEKASISRTCPAAARRSDRHGPRRCGAGSPTLGATGLLVPEEYGGAGMTMVEAGIVAEELGAALHPGPWLSTAVAATRALTRFGRQRHRRPKLLRRHRRRHHDRRRRCPTRRARPIAAGRQDDAIVLRGEIAAVPDAAAADVLLVAAEDADGTALFAVRRPLVRALSDAPSTASTRPASTSASRSTTHPRNDWPRPPRTTWRRWSTTC